MTARDTVHHLFTEAVRRRPERTAVIDETRYGRGAALTYAQLDAGSRELSAGLHSLGLRRGDAVALLLPSCAEWVLTFLAAARLGLLVVPLNTRYRSPELLHLLRVSSAKALVVAPAFETADLASRLVDVWPHRGDLDLRWLVPVHAETVPGAPAEMTTVQLERLRRASRGEPVPEPAGRAADPLVVFGTSGTTSAPKLALHTQESVARHVSRVAGAVRLTEDDVALSVLPLNGTFGFVPFAAGLTAGTAQVLLPVYELDRTIRAILRHDVTFASCAEGPLRELLADPRIAGGSAHALRRVITAGVAIDDIVAAAGEIGVRAGNVYGSSEIFAFAATWDFDAPAAQRTVAGGRLADPKMCVRAVDPDTGRPLPEGAEGELQFRGPTVFTGYLANPDATERVLTPDGWYRSGDRGRTLPGRAFEYHSRLGDAMRLKGYLVNPADIESCLENHPAVELAQLVGVRDPHSGDDRPIAFVKPRPGAVAEPQELLQHCRRLLAGFKVPQHVHVLDEFPSTPSANGDKVRKDRLREMAAALLDPPRPKDPVRSSIAWAAPDQVVVHGIDLAADVLGHVGLGDFAFLELFGRLPDDDESAVFNALVVALVEHGLTPSALVTRLTHLGAPESLQGAVAAGLLGLGDTFVGTMEGAARYCAEAAADPAWRTDDEALAALADRIVASFLDQRRAVPGIGHPIHKPLDPRAERLFVVAREHGVDHANERLVRAVSAAASARTGRELPVNVTGAIGAIATAMGVPLHVVRGLGVMARAIGLVGHLVEEGERPIAGHVWRETEHRAAQPPAPSAPVPGP